jgi:hypothetical protein
MSETAGSAHSHSQTVMQFIALVTCASNSAANDIIAQTPSLLWPRMWPFCEGLIESIEGPTEKMRAEVVLGSLRGVAAQFDAQPGLG